MTKELDIMATIRYILESTTHQSFQNETNEVCNRALYDLAYSANVHNQLIDDLKMDCDIRFNFIDWLLTENNTKMNIDVYGSDLDRLESRPEYTDNILGRKLAALDCYFSIIGYQMFYDVLTFNNLTDLKASKVMIEKMLNSQPLNKFPELTFNDTKEFFEMYYKIKPETMHTRIAEQFEAIEEILSTTCRQ